MKHMKKILALVIAMVMVLGMMSLTAFAAEGDRTISITGLDTGDKVSFYQILSWAEDSAAATQHGAVNGWYWTEPLNTKLTTQDLKDAVNDKNQLYLTDELAGKIARAINESGATALEGSPVTESSGTATLTFTGQAAGSTAKDGLYMAVITPKDQDTVYNPVFVHLDSSTDSDSIAPSSNPSYMNNGAAKKSKVTLTKESHNTADYTTPADDGDTAKPGDELTFTVKTTIPGYGEMFTEPEFKLTDKMNGLELETNTIEVKVGGETLAASNYELKPAPTTEQYVIDFKPAYLKTLVTATEVEITYKAKVKAGANTNVIKEKNTVELEFSHDPSTESESNPGGNKNYKKDITNHYTFSIDANNLVGPTEDRIGESGSEIIKIGVDKDGKPITSEKTWSNVTTTKYQESPLQGAEFELLDKDKKSFDPKKTATSDASGRLNFTGLDAGEYWLKETKAPAGYVKQSDPVKIKIDAVLEEREITEYYDQDGNWYSSEGQGRKPFTYKTKELKSYSITYGNEASKYTFEHVHESNNGEIKWNIASSSEAPQSIANAKGVELPSTGGMGTTIFYIIGAILVIGAGVVLITRRRMNAE